MLKKVQSAYKHSILFAVRVFQLPSEFLCISLQVGQNERNCKGKIMDMDM